MYYKKVKVKILKWLKRLKSIAQSVLQYSDTLANEDNLFRNHIR
jgi:hypothetical protein